MKNIGHIIREISNLNNLQDHIVGMSRLSESNFVLNGTFSRFLNPNNLNNLQDHIVGMSRLSENNLVLLHISYTLHFLDKFYFHYIPYIHLDFHSSDILPMHKLNKLLLSENNHFLHYILYK